jgi:hypothetical protein
MNCDTLDGGISLGCSNNLGGTSRLWLAEKANITNTTLSSPGDEISAFTMAGSPVSKFYEYEFNKNTSSYTQEETHDEASGRDLVIVTITLILNRREKTKRDNLLLLRGKKLAAVIEDNNLVCWYASEVMMTTNTGGSGTAKTDPNQYVITLVGELADPMNTVLTAAIEAVD